MKLNNYRFGKFFQLLLILLAVSCTSEESVVSLEPEHPASTFRTLEEAIALAQASQSLFTKGESSTRSEEIRMVDRENSFAISKNATRSSDDNGNALYYVINYCDSMGFAIISANKNTEDILALTESGSYDGMTPSEVEGFNDFIDLMGLYLELPLTPSTKPIKPVFSDTIWTEETRLLDTRWGQTGVTGAYCPNGIAGCVPLAVAEILSYHQYPTSIALTYPEADITTQNLDWTEINKHKEESLLCIASDSTHNALGRLCRQLGKMMHSTYYFDGRGTGTFDDYIRGCFLSLGYEVMGWRYNSPNCCISPITNMHPLLFIGFRETSSGDVSGHAWVVDGFVQRTVLKNVLTEITDEGRPIYSTTREETTFNHVNWGWHGKCNGYFLDGVFDTSNPYKYDRGSSSSTSRNYNISVHYLEVYR